MSVSSPLSAQSTSCSIRFSNRIRPNRSQRPQHTQPDKLVYQIGDKLYINLTDRCTLRCGFCPKHNGTTEVKGYELYLSARPDPAHIIKLIGDPTRYTEVVFCGYGEPTLRLKALLVIAHAVKAAGGHTRINTDGLGSRVNKRDIVPELAQCIDALSISLNAQNAAVYNQHCQPALNNAWQSVLTFIERASRQIPAVYVSAIDGLPGVDITACKALAESRGGIFRRRVLGEVG
ncbi:MAG: TatD family nuclease-associated radical SAM protein [Marinobacterium sp.]|nr:TatD family nuclease-associated radical SAM protein [Marinobacterium sp.]